MVKIQFRSSKRWPLWIAAIFVTILVSGLGFLILRTPAAIPGALVLENQPIALPEPESSLVEKVETVQRNATLQDILLDSGLSYQQIHDLVSATEPVYNLHRLRAGNQLTIETDALGQFRGIRYEISPEEYLLTRFDGQAYQAEKIAYPIETDLVALAGQIDSSLWETILDLDEDPRLAASLNAILQWDIDFTVLQPGDWFKVLIEKRYREDQFIGYGKLHAVQFHTNKRDYWGFFFKEPGKKGRYFDVKGVALRKAFLRVPFSYSPRISSGFSYSRLHPILKIRRPHPALDFAAPRGTPVLASGNGRVVWAGRKGGLGNFVQIKHPNGYKTGYAHLSKILVKNGRSVSQGQRIGLVGSTGLATAAHLDYRIWDPKGRYVNPRKRVSWPSDEEPVDKAYWDAFVSLRDSLQKQLGLIPENRFKGPADLFKAE